MTAVASLILQILEAAANLAPEIIDAIKAWSSGNADPTDPIHARIVAIMGGPLNALEQELEDLKK
jgi:hypothetical protein